MVRLKKWAVVLVGFLVWAATTEVASAQPLRRNRAAAAEASHEGAKQTAPAGNLPAPVSQSFQARFPQGKMTGSESEAEDGVTLYSIDFKDGGAEKSTLIAADGTVMEIVSPVQSTDVPPAAMNAIKQAAGGASIAGIQRIDITHEVEHGAVKKLGAPAAHYAAELNGHGKTGEVLVGSDGKVLEPVSWE